MALAIQVTLPAPCPRRDTLTLRPSTIPQPLWDREVPPDHEVSNGHLVEERWAGSKQLCDALEALERGKSLRVRRRSMQSTARENIATRSSSLAMIRGVESAWKPRSTRCATYPASQGSGSLD